MKILVIDTSGPVCGTAVMDETKVYSEFTAQNRLTHSASLMPMVEETLNAAGTALHDLDAVAAVTGPGSFTGMRLASALVKGWVFGYPEIQVRCVPSALIAADAATADRVAVLQDGRNQEMLVFGLKKQNGTYLPDGFTAVWNREQAAEQLPVQNYGEWVVSSADEAAVRKLLPETATDLQICRTYSAAPLLRAELPYDGDLDKLVYIRPAVFS